ncbi:ATP-binding protein [Achromobacter insolitus]|uniref:ATP-binding protein n=1 Tax=Achromobacter insolitus TaxID=217204 RepID=UPI003B9DAA77
MDLSDFIDAHLDELVGDWEQYARELSVDTADLSGAELRNSGRNLLVKIAANMRVDQSPEQQRDKSLGVESGLADGFDQVSIEHANRRFAQGFGLNDVVAEFRALRASVLRQWEKNGATGPGGFQQMIRFNEAIDQGLTESVRQYALRAQRVRDLFSGVLAHDLRSPLGVVLNSAEILLCDKSLSPAGIKATAYMQRSALRMKRMIDDLLVFSGSRLGAPLPLELTRQDMGRICQNVIEEINVLFPHVSVRLNHEGETAGTWDAGRIGQLFFNLLSNAARYGKGGIDLIVTGQAEGVEVVVANTGNPIPRSAFPTLFDPLTRVLAIPNEGGMAAGIGLGLYICRSIVMAHHGAIEVESDDFGTAFTVRLPLNSGAAGASPPPGV